MRRPSRGKTPAQNKFGRMLRFPSGKRDRCPQINLREWWIQ
jgi:hypothetical protein